MATKRHAFVSGVSHYVYQPLRGPAYDVEDMSRELRDKAQCRVQTCLDATKSEFKARLRQFCNGLPKGTQAIFFFAGHGATQYSTQQHYLVCKEAHAAEPSTSSGGLSEEGVAVEDVLNQIAEAVGPAGSIVAILDTCRSVSFRGRSTDTSTAAIEHTQQHRQKPNSIETDKILGLLAAGHDHMELQKRLRDLALSSSSNGIGSSRRHTPTLLCHACNPGQTASEGGALERRNGWYTSCILKHMFRPSYDSLLKALSAANTEYNERFPAEDRASPMELPGQGDATPFLEPFILQSTGSRANHHPAAPSFITTGSLLDTIPHSSTCMGPTSASCVTPPPTISASIPATGSGLPAAVKPNIGTLTGLSKPTSPAGCSATASAHTNSKLTAGLSSMAAGTHVTCTTASSTGTSSSSTSQATHAVLAKPPVAAGFSSSSSAPSSQATLLCPTPAKTVNTSSSTSSVKNAALPATALATPVMAVNPSGTSNGTASSITCIIKPSQATVGATTTASDMPAMTSYSPKQQSCQTAGTSSGSNINTVSSWQPQLSSVPARPTWKVTTVLDLCGTANSTGPDQQKAPMQLPSAYGNSMPCHAVPSSSNGTGQVAANCPRAHAAPTLSPGDLNKKTVAELKAWAIEHYSDGCEVFRLAMAPKTTKAAWVALIVSEQQRQQQ